MFPRVAVFERQLSGERSGLYVYRDGRYEPEPTDSWWQDARTAVATVSVGTGRITGIRGPWPDLLQGEDGQLVGRHFAEFVVPEAQEVAQAMFEAVSEQREVSSEALVARPDGSTVPISFRAVKSDGEIEVFVRPLSGGSR